MIEIQEWGLIDFNDAWERQKTLANAVLKGDKPSTLVLCEHPTVITIGRNGTTDNVVATQEELAERNVNVIPINRGGDVTLHNPGQLVGYPIFRLTDFREDLHWFLREIEECIIATIANFGVNGARVDGATGVWIEQQRKVCAIGIHCSRWITSHGFALNVKNNISEFDMIIPCGITDKDVTSIEFESHLDISFERVKDICGNEFRHRFN